MIYLVLAAVIWGSSFPVIAYALDDISPFLFLVLRFVIAFLILIPRWRKPGAFRTLFRRDLFLIALPNALSFVLQYKGQELTTASKAALFVNSAPVWVVIMSLFLRRSVLPRQLFATLIALAGVVVVSTRLDFSSFGVINLGDLMCIGVGVLWGVFIMFSGPIVKRYGPYDVAIVLYFWTMAYGTPFMLAEQTRFAWVAAPAVVYLALITTVLAYVLYLKGVQLVPPVATSIVILIEVIVAYVIANIFLGEVFSTVETVGVLLVMLGVILVVWSPRKRLKTA